MSKGGGRGGVSELGATVQPLQPLCVLCALPSCPSGRHQPQRRAPPACLGRHQVAARGGQRGLGAGGHRVVSCCWCLSACDCYCQSAYASQLPLCEPACASLRMCRCYGHCVCDSGWASLLLPLLCASLRALRYCGDGRHHTNRANDYESVTPCRVAVCLPHYRPSVCVCVSVCLPVCLSACLPFCLSVFLSF